MEVSLIQEVFNYYKKSLQIQTEARIVGDVHDSTGGLYKTTMENIARELVDKIALNIELIKDLESVPANNDDQLWQGDRITEEKAEEAPNLTQLSDEIALQKQYTTV